MLKTLRFANYKAFEKGEVEIKPITILLGGNSSGKSSILKLIQILSQTVNYKEGYNSALKLTGKMGNFGIPLNLFRNQNTSNNTLDIGVDLTESDELSRFVEQAYERLKRGIDELLMDLERLYGLGNAMMKITEGKNKILINDVYSIGLRRHKYYQINRKKFGPGEQSYQKKIRRLNYLQTGIKKIELRSESFKPNSELSAELHERWKILSNRIKKEKVNDFSTKDLKNIYETLSSLRTGLKKGSENITVEFKIRYKPTGEKNGRELLMLKEIGLYLKNKKIIRLNLGSLGKGGSRKTLDSDIIPQGVLNRYKSSFFKSIEFQGLFIKSEGGYWRGGVPIMRRDIVFSTVPLILSGLISKTTFLLYRNLEETRINYVSPLRAYPQRYYFLDSANISTSLDSVDGNNLAEILKKNKNIRAQVNEWLKRIDLGVSVEDVKEIIHQIKISQSGMKLNIADVGFGISQILPIIVQGFMSRRNSLTIIEQPEIHLHPRLQADLGDLFIDIITNKTEDGYQINGKSLIIETHSEYLLKRIRRRMAEGEQITNDDVAIYFIDPQRGRAKPARIKRVSISETGAFDWPNDFYSTDMEDTIEFMRHQ